MSGTKYIHYLLLLAVSLCFRLFFVNSYGLWSDELVAVLSAKGQYPIDTSVVHQLDSKQLQALNTLPQVIKSTNYYDSGNAVVYTTGLHYWLSIFGWGELVVRLLSVLCSVLSTLLLYRLAILLFKSSTAALFSALLFAIHPLSIEYAQQARSYSMAVLFSLASTYYFFKGLKFKKTSHFVWYAFFSLLALLSHYLSIGVLMAQGFIFVMSRPTKKTLTPLLLAVGTSLFLFFLWLKTGGAEGLKMMAQRNAAFTHLAHSAAAEQNAFYLPATFANICAGTLQVLLQICGNLLQDLNFKLREISFLLAVPFSVLFFAFRLLYKSQSNSTKLLAYMLVFVLVHLFFSTALAIQAGHCISFQPLYANFVVPYMCIALGFATTTVLKHSALYSMQVAIVIAVPIIFIISLLPVYTGQNGRLPKQQKYALMAQQLEKQDTVLVNSFGTAQLLFLYSNENQTQHYQLDRTIKNDTAISGKHQGKQ